VRAPRVCRGPQSAREAWREVASTGEALLVPGARASGSVPRAKSQGSRWPRGRQIRSEYAGTGEPITRGRGGQAYGAGPGTMARTCRGGPQCPPPCQAEHSRRKARSRLGFGTSMGGSMRTCGETGGGRSRKTLPPAWTGGVPKRTRTTWRTTSRPLGSVSSANAPVPNSSDDPLGRQGGKRPATGDARGGG
jgi:hypothetical protein